MVFEVYGSRLHAASLMYAANLNLHLFDLVHGGTPGRGKQIPKDLNDVLCVLRRFEDIYCALIFFLHAFYFLVE